MSERHEIGQAAVWHSLCKQLNDHIKVFDPEIQAVLEMQLGLLNENLLNAERNQADKDVVARCADQAAIHRQRFENTIPISAAHPRTAKTLRSIHELLNQIDVQLGTLRDEASA